MKIAISSYYRILLLVYLAIQISCHTFLISRDVYCYVYWLALVIHMLIVLALVIVGRRYLGVVKIKDHVCTSYWMLPPQKALCTINLNEKVYYADIEVIMERSRRRFVFISNYPFDIKSWKRIGEAYAFYSFNQTLQIAIPYNKKTAPFFKYSKWECVI